MNRPFVSALCFAVVVVITACTVNKTRTENTNQSNRSEVQQSPSVPSATQSTPAQAGDLQPGQASGTYTAKGEVVELKYAYAGRAERFGNE
ncbi:MAG TPA: hypothetical protein VFT48_01410, partial [Pyrinomonadaceae bacterium]|nr:hypothetical protein [Pyrinomonadaceae bacterium]